MLRRSIPFLCVLVATALIASVLAPAHESARVLALLDDDGRLIEPARRAMQRVESGIADESAERQRFDASRDAASVRRGRTAMAQVDGALRDLGSITARLDGRAARESSSLIRLVGHWRRVSGDSSFQGRDPRPGLDSLVARQAVRDSIVVAAARVQAELGTLGSQWRAALAAHERRGLLVNALLVLVAIAAIATVLEVTRRELRRVQREAALRLAAEAFAGAFTSVDISQQVVRSAVQLLRAKAAWVCRVDKQSDGQRTVIVVAEGSDSPAHVLDTNLLDSIVERAVIRREPMIVAHASEDTHDRPRSSRERRPHWLVIPLGTATVPVGLVIVEESADHRFRAEDVSWVGILGNLAFLALEKVRLLEEARDGRQRLERAMESRGRLMRGFSHDVKNPLGAADGYAALLRDGIYGAVTDEQRRSVDRVRQAIHRAISLIDDLHELARAETGNLSVELERTSIGGLVHMMADEYRAAVEAKRLQFAVDVDASLPVVETDPSRIRQIIANLLSNAIKYTDEGAITVRARVERARPEQPLARVLVDVIDTGPGIPADKTDLIFEEFERLASQRTSGAGLGLAISRRVAEALGCQIRVESQVGRGSMFTLCIPVDAGERLRNAEDDFSTLSLAE